MYLCVYVYMYTHIYREREVCTHTHTYLLKGLRSTLGDTKAYLSLGHWNFIIGINNLSRLISVFIHLASLLLVTTIPPFLNIPSFPKLLPSLCMGTSSFFFCKTSFSALLLHDAFPACVKGDQSRLWLP